MGWWTQDTEGRSFAADSEMMWGDGPADVIGAALEAIVQDFQRSLHRPPTKAEVRAGIEFTLRAWEEPA